ncbi:hypothetical protein CBS101457_006392 [Exobasidium rhododendri]|nr:hypothetical protein CBS101457_006392 [Exobasidium rhododendri]
MTDGKKKRTRKRQRKSNVADESEQPETKNAIIKEEEEEEEEDDDNVKEEHSAVEDLNRTGKNNPAVSAAYPAANSTIKSPLADEDATPKLSFYQRTNPHKPSALSSLHGSAPRRYTVSVAIPGSIILNAQSPELQARLAGQLARSCAIFNIDEIVIFNEVMDGEQTIPTRSFQHHSMAQPEESFGDHAGDQFDPNAFLARILQYVETPQYLRKLLFPMHRDLRMAGILAPLDCPHHLRYEEDSPYREGVCVEAPHWAHDRNLPWFYTGLKDPIQCTVKGKSGADAVPLGARVTIKMPVGGKRTGHIVSPREPVQEKGLYWGYTVRLCNSLSEAVSAPCWNEPYDLVIGTSERGSSLTDVLEATANNDTTNTSSPPLNPFEHALIVFGGLSGLEVAVERDANINLTADEASELFDSWLNVVEGQGSRTIRTEEALLITLARLKPTLEALGKR